MPSKAPTSHKVIRISSIQQKTTQKGKVMWTVSDEHDDFFSIFDEMVRARLQEGQVASVIIEVQERGGKSYKNIVGLDAVPVAAAGEVAVADLLPGATPASQTPIQQPLAPAPTPPSIPAEPQQVVHKPLNVMTSMVDIRIAALHNATRLCAAGIITANQIEHNSKQFERYIIGIAQGEHNYGSEGEVASDYVA